MKIAEIMSRSVIVCSPQSNLESISLAMRDGNFGSVPMLSEDNVPTGMITDRDICLAVGLCQLPASDIRALDVVDNLVTYTCHIDDDIDSALQIMSEQGVRRLPVVDDSGKLKGIVTIGDVINHSLETPGAHSKSTNSHADQTGEVSVRELLNTLKTLSNAGRANC